MRILCVATKCPWPPSDGGRLVLALTLQALAAAGHEIAVVAPADTLDDPGCAIADGVELHRVDSRRRSWAVSAVCALASGRAMTLDRHDQRALRDAVTERIARWRPHVVHAEQLHALAACESAFPAGIPVVLRMQNVESALWERLAKYRFPAALLRAESRRLRAAEKAAVMRSAATIALTVDDTCALAALTTDAVRVVCVEPAFAVREDPMHTVQGDPAIVLAGSAGWWPNAQGERWFLAQVWPLLRAELPRAQLHIFGGDKRSADVRVQRHSAPAQSQTAFPQGAIAIVPLLIASGIRMRILEAWARGLPVVATSVAARGLQVISGRELLIADSPREFSNAVLRACSDAALRQQLAEGGRAYLRRHHDPQRQTQMLLEQYALSVNQNVARLPCPAGAPA